MDGLSSLTLGFFFRRHATAGVTHGVICLENLLDEAL